MFELTRIFRASEHEFSIAKFHEYSDKKGPTLVVAKSEHQKTFGGFTSVDWNKDRNNNWETDPTAFLFQLDQKTMHRIKDDKKANAIY